MCIFAPWDFSQKKKYAQRFQYNGYLSDRAHLQDWLN